MEGVTRLVSVITPVHKPSVAYLPEAYASLTGQKMPDGWDWQWLVQEDGQDGILTGLFADDRVSLGAGRSGGPGVTRTLALARAEGDLIKVLDADDQLTPGALARDIAALEEQPRIGWTTSRVLDLLPDGSTVGFPADPPPGLIHRGDVLTFWKANDYRASVHPATLCIRRDLLLALGGWMALPASEDTGLLIAASVVTDGWFIPDPGLLYRKWPGQVTSQATHREPVEHSARMRLIEQRARVLANMQWTATTPDMP